MAAVMLGIPNLSGGDLPEVLSWVIRHGYILMFVAMVVEGPLTTIASAFGAALGYFDVYWVVLLSFLGNLLPDCLYYFVGAWGGPRLLERYGRPLGVTRERLDQWASLASRNLGPWLFFAKEVPFIGPTGIAMMGALRVPVRQYLGWDIAINAVTALLLAAIGFGAGRGYTQLLHYTQYQTYILVGGLVLFLLVAYLYRKTVKKLWAKADSPDGPQAPATDPRDVNLHR